MNKTNEKEDTKLTYSICEVEMDGKMALVSLYDDLPHFEYDLTIDKLKSSNNKLKILIQELEQHIRRIEKEHSQLKATNEILSNNIVSLYKTACREIKRKDIMINELRNSCSAIKPPPESKMFASSKLPLGKTQFNDLSNKKQNTLQTYCDEEKCKTTNQNNCVNIPNIAVKPNNDIPKTVYYKRLCQKLTKQNENILSKNKTKKNLDTHTSTITSEKTQDKNVCLTNDQNVLKELESPVLCNDFYPNHNSTLIICEPDMPPSDSELSTTSVIQCNNSEKSKENISTKPSSLKLRPKICKKKFVIAPASIGVLNVSNETSKCIEKLRNNKNLELKVVLHKISDPLETKLIKDPIEGTPPLSFEKPSSNINADVDNKHVPRTGIVHDQKICTHKINNETPPMSNEVLKVDFGKKTPYVKKNSVKLPKVKNLPKVTGSSPLIDSNKMLTNYTTKSSVNNEHKSSNQPLEKTSELKCTLNDIDGSSKSIAVATNLINSSSKNHPVKVTAVRKSTPVISLGPSVDNDLNTSTEYVNCSSKNNEKESSLTKGKNNQLKCMLNDNVESFPKNTAVQTNLTNNISTQPKNSKTRKIDPVKMTTLRKSSQVISLGLSDDNDCKMSTNYVNCSFVTNEKESSQYKEKKIQLKCVSHDTVESSPKNTADETNITNKIITPSKITETEKNDTFKLTTIKKSSRVISLGISSDNDHNMSTKYVSCSSINNDKESSQYKEKDNKLRCISHCTVSPKNTADETNFTNKMSTPYKSIETGLDTFNVTTIRKSSRVISLGLSDDNDCNTSTEYINCSSTSNKKESSQYKKKNNQLKCISHYTVENSPKNTADETNLTTKISTPYKSIDTGENDTIKVTTVRKSPKRICFSHSDDQSPNVAVTHVKCSNNVMKTNNVNESFCLPKQTNSQSKCDVSNIINNSFNVALKTSPTSKISIPYKNIEVDQVPARKSTENINFVKKTSQVVSLGCSVDNDLNSLTKYVKCSSMTAEKESSSRPKEKNDQLGCNLNDVVKSTSKNISVGTIIGDNISLPSVHSKVEQVPTKTKRKEIPRKHFPVETKVMKSSGSSVDYESNKFTKKVPCLPIKQSKDPFILLKQNDNQSTCKLSINNCRSDLKEITKSNDHRSFSKSTEVDSGKQRVLSTSIDVDNKLACSNLSQDEINQEFKKGRRVQLITIQDHYSEPLPSFNGAKKTEIDVSKNSVHIEKEVESSSRFYVPQAKRRKLSNFGNIEL